MTNTEKPTDSEIIENWIMKQNGFFIPVSDNIECPLCYKNVAKRVITKKTGLCMPCFILQIVQACKTVKESGKHEK